MATRQEHPEYPGGLLRVLLFALILFLAVGSGVRGNNLCGPVAFARRRCSANCPLQRGSASCWRNDWVAAAGANTDYESAHANEDPKTDPYEG